MPQAPTETQVPFARRSEPIPGYVLRQRIGAGGYGEVWSAEAPGGLVKAIKFVYGLMDESRAAREFKSLSLIKGVRHPFLLSLERIEILDGQLLIVTELADGSLKERFEECVKTGQIGIPREELLAHLRDAADALDYMNSQHSLQHLDVKPENLLLVGGRIKVADFGLVKEIQEVSASLMGGLTPIYAPPEVFDARPSRRSDQYSLAIVYQEMLTGVLPFPGKTPAQLAAQHLTASPRLTPLIASDQAVIARALSKDPQNRFASCREMVEALLHTCAAAAPNPVAVSYGNSSPGAPAAAGASQTQFVAQPSGTQPTTNEQEMLRRLECTETAANFDSQGNYVAAESVAIGAVSTDSDGVRQPPASLIDLPPLEVDLSSWICQPTLFLGIGGLAGKSLQQLKHKLEDQCDSKQREKFSFLLLDTDARELGEATHGQQGAALRPEETLALPLRKSADYRNDPQKYLDWLSRRWLYNIPRSQQTEGIRPFGRLAFIDHAPEVLPRLKGAVSQLVATAKSADAQHPPRVIIVGSSAGGAASGMLLDVVFAVRQLLSEQQDQGLVDLLLIHGSGRQAATQELAAVNTFALLTEINHCLRLGGNYPGEFSCGLRPRAASERTIDSLYLAHLGENLGNDQFLVACNRLAEFLFLDAATPAGAYLSACRAAEPQEKRQDVTLRTFGLCQIGFSGAAVSRGVESLCRATVQLWSGEPKEQVASSLSARIADMSKDNSNCPVAAKDAELESLATGQAKVLGLDLEEVMQRLYQLATEELGGEPMAIFEGITQESPQALRMPPPVDKWFAGSARFFGAQGGETEPSPSSPLQAALLKRLGQVVAPLGLRLRDWLLALPEDPEVRIFGGQWCTKWFRSHLKTLAEKAQDVRAKIGLQLQHLEQKLALAAKTVSKSAHKSKGAATDPNVLFLQHCQLRLYQLSSHIAIQYTQNLAGYVSQASDQLHELGREIKNLAHQFTVFEQPPNDAIELAAHTQLQQDEETSARILDQHFQENVFSSARFRSVLQAGDQRHHLIAELQQQARRIVLESLRQVSLSALVKELGKPDSNQASRLGERIAAALPWLQQVGGERRLLCASGSNGQSGEGQGLTPAEVSGLVASANFKQLPAVIPSSLGQVVFCFEIGNVPLSHAAAQIIDNRPDFALAAARLHARSDITWQELPR